MNDSVSVSSAERALFLVAGAANWLAALGFAAPGSATWRMIGLSSPEQTLFLHLFVALVALFGLTYFWIGLNPFNKDALIVIAAIGKISACAVVVGHYVAGSAPFGLVLFISGDLVFAVLFLAVVRRHRDVGAYRRDSSRPRRVTTGGEDNQRPR